MFLFSPIVPVLLLLFFFCVLLRKKIKTDGVFSIQSFIIAIYLTSTLFSIILLLYPEEASYRNVYFLPMVLFAFMWYISYIPLRKVSIQNETEIISPSDSTLVSYLWFIAFWGLLALPDFFENFTNIWNGALEQSFFNELYMNKNEDIASNVDAISSSLHIGSIMRGMTSHISIFFLMYYLTKEKKNKLLLISLIIGIVISPISAMATASRGNLTRIILIVLFSYLLFKNKYSYKTKKVLSIILFSFLGVIILALVLITISRFTQSYMADDYMRYKFISYLGQPILNFNEAAAENDVIRYGDRVLPLFKMLFIPDGAYTYAARIAKYKGMVITEASFSTYLGETILDFGIILSVIFWVVLSGLMLILSPKNRTVICFEELIIVYIVAYNIVCGWALSPYTDVGGNIKVIFYILTYLYFKFHR